MVFVIMVYRSSESIRRPSMSKSAARMRGGGLVLSMLVLGLHVILGQYGLGTHFDGFLRRFGTSMKMVADCLGSHDGGSRSSVNGYPT